MSVTEVKKIAVAYGRRLKKNNFPVTGVYLFGSYAKGKAEKNSDIDLAVIGNSRKKYWDIITFLNKASLDVDIRIEPHYFKASDFDNESSAMASEIRRTGIEIVG